MYDKELVNDILNQILDATQKVITRFTSIKTAEDLVPIVYRLKQGVEV